MFENLSDRLSKTLRNISGKGRLTEDNIKRNPTRSAHGVIRSRRCFACRTWIYRQSKRKRIRRRSYKSLTPGQEFLKIVQRELEKAMGEANESLNLATQPPAVILMAGLQGAGKTTSVGKLAKFLRERHKRKCL